MAKDKVTDMSLSIGERADAMLAAEHGDVDNEIEVSSRAALIPQSSSGQEEFRQDIGSLIPDLTSIYGAQAQSLSLDLKNVTGFTPAMDAPSAVRVRKVIEPEDIYDPALNPALVNLVVLFLKDHMSQGEIAEVFRLAHGRNIPLVSLLRQNLWSLIWNMKARLDGAPEGRLPEHDSEQALENKRLILLLEFSVWEQLNNRARQHNCSPAVAFAFIVKNAMAANTL